MSAPRAAGAASRAGRALLALWLVLPLVPLLLWAFADRWAFPAVLPQEWGTRGAEEALAAGAGGAFLRSTLLGAVVAALATPLGAMAGRALASRQVPAGTAVLAVLLAPLALPPFAVALGLDVLLLRLRVPAALGVVLLLVVVAVPYTTLTMRAAYAAHDRGFEDVARTLGAGRWRTVRSVQLPLVAPALAGAAFLAFLVGWSDYIVTVLVGGGRLTTLPLLVAAAAAATGSEAQVAVLSLTAILPPVALLVVVGSLGRRGRRA
ncbi:ABC transporter permease [Blastococcus xanthinilyticus]|uniref:Putative spermidine/putrescine transport system permease protein n=1 Tax=Blastococcus xanthinilyticus TaxID=1564164 RepID=A0A5S5CWE3_9ACTN|nr:ABC transporter permease subunit [Blastococcus xanthinilyticus]TYP88033.1 putative spermidine/putrescine transport system permease protein [Blastococcus xanthinilyticus]